MTARSQGIILTAPHIEKMYLAHPHAASTITYGSGPNNKSKPGKSGSLTDCRVEEVECDTH